MLKETGRKYECKLIVDESHFIDNDYGGVILLSKDKKIIIGNDLKTRLLLSKEKHLPIIKNLLFPKTTTKAKAPKDEMIPIPMNED